ncbi:Chromosome transmission fidelity protein 18 [Dimargaris verticillata]|uniref:Chromosome transmission fidelity protein 18 n=1 Tax=Dimargaris verticillata TaxID=2761393 RepID=A0A9W8B810_9FUNG|nr:Chromosome transmission fidelity protein 18 [Dimargaris verticillata]
MLTQPAAPDPLEHESVNHDATVSDVTLKRMRTDRDDAAALEATEPAAQLKKTRVEISVDLTPSSSLDETVPLSQNLFSSAGANQAAASRTSLISPSAKQQWQSWYDDEPSSSQSGRSSQPQPPISASSAGASSQPTSHILTTRAHNFGLPPTKGSFVMASSSSGKRLYFPKRHSSDGTGSGQNGLERSDYAQYTMAFKNQLLDVSIYRLLDEVDRDRVNRALAASDAQTIDAGPSQPNGQEVSRFNTSGPSMSNTAPKPRMLWVDKYRPQHFADLVSDDKVNREALLWLKQWDYCVFGRTNPPWRPGTRKFGSQRPPSAPFQLAAADTKPVVEAQAKDRYHRPFRRILLLAGPPGLGKTTLAHIIAHQAGYTTMEINASDDRTGTQVYQKLVSITQTHSVRSSGKPTALIIDEIDGVASSGSGRSSHNAASGKDFVSLLVGMATADPPRKTKTRTTFSEVADQNTTKKVRRTGPPPLMRPIICICNDLYAPSLRALRAVAQVYHIRRPAPASLARRLQMVCATEGLRADLSTLVSLSERAECDLRNCLHTLQFLQQHSSVDGRITWDMIKRAPVGVKDMQRSLFQLWGRVFTPATAQRLGVSLAPPPTQATGAAGATALPSSTATPSIRIKGQAFQREYTTNLLHDLAASHEYEKLIAGCFENYLKLRFHDTYFDKIVQVGDWLAFYDQLNTSLYRAGPSGSHAQAALHNYMPYPFLYFHRALANPFAKTMEFSYPRVDYEMHLRQKTCHGTLLSVLQGVRSVTTRRTWTVPQMAVGLTSWLSRIISAEISGHNLQLLTSDDRSRLFRLVEILVAFGLTYVQERTEQGEMYYRLEPPLGQALVSTKAASGSTAVSLSNKYATQQMIAQEVEKEIIRRREAILNAQASHSPKAKASAGGSKREALVPRPIIQDKLENPTRTIVVRDFFGRHIAPRAKADGHDSNQPTAASSGSGMVKPAVCTWDGTKVWYQYNEGYSNAVRKPVRIRDLLPAHENGTSTTPEI